MKKQLLFTLLVAATIMTYVGCGNDNAASTLNTANTANTDNPTDNRIETENSIAIESNMETAALNDETDVESFSTEYVEDEIEEPFTEIVPIVFEDSAQWRIDPSTFKEYCETEDDLIYYNEYIANLKPDWSDGTWNYHDLQGNNEIGIGITYWDSAPFNVYDDQYKTSILCAVHGINFSGIYQCEETAYIYGYIKTTSDNFYDSFDFEGYGWIDPRELEDGYMISY